MADDLQRARDTLDTVRRKQLRIAINAAVYLTLAAIIVLFLTGATVEAIFRLSITPRSWMLGGISLGAVLFAILVFSKPLRDPRLRRGNKADQWWALELGRSAPDKLRDRLLNAIQVSGERSDERWPHSTDLSAQALYLAVADLEDISFEKALNRMPLKTAGWIAGLSAAILCVPLVLTPTSFTSAADRLLHPRSSFEIPPPFTLTIEPGDSWVYRGEPVEFTILGDGDPPAEVEFVYRHPGGQPQVRHVEMSDNIARFRLEGFATELEYHARHSNIKSPTYQLEVITRPRIADLSYRLTPPGYSGLPAVTGPDNVGDIDGLPGSRVRLDIKANKPLAEAWLVFLSSDGKTKVGDSLTMEVKQQTGTVRFRLWRDAGYQIRLLDKGGHSAKDPVTYRLRLLEDHAPSVRILFPEVDIDLGDAMQVPIHSEAYDDFGISKLELGHRVLGQDTTAQFFELPTIIVEKSVVQSQFLWDLGAMFLMPGDVVEFWAKAWDNDVIHGPKFAESERRLIRLPTFEEIIAGVDQSEQESMETAEKTLAAAQELKEDISEIIEEMKRNPEVDWERQQQIESSLDMQSELKEQVEEITSRLDELIAKLEKHDLSSLETLEKYEELQRLLAEVATPELQAAMDKLRKALESQDPDKLQKAMDEFDFNREQFLENMERTIEILRQLQLERNLDELVNRTEELLRKQEKLNERIERGEDSSLASQQESLASQTEQLQKELNDVASLADEMGESELSSDLDSLSKMLDSRETSANMRRSSANLSAGDRERAAEKSSDAARDLSDLASGLSEASVSYKNRRKEDLARKMRRLAQELMYISAAQEELATESHDLGTHSPRYRGLAGDQEDIRAALRNVIDRVYAVARETFFITPDLGASLGKAVHEIDKSLDFYSSRNPRSVATPQSKALGEINSSTRQLLALLQQLSGSSSASGFEEMMERLSDMANAQQGLNQQSMPIPGAGSPGQQGQMQQLSRMAAEQRALQQAMEDAASEASGMQDILGDLDGIAETMGEVADDLEENSVTTRTRRLQRQIVSRLLDATRSVREKEYSRKRESRGGKRIVRRSPGPLELDSDREKLRRDLLKALQEGYTRDYRQLIRQYFQALETIEEPKVKD